MKSMEFPVNSQFSNYIIREALKTLRANLLFCSSGKKVILFSSCQAHEGKTTITVEVAHCFANAGKKVLVIDADLRKSTMMRRYCSESGTVGMSQYLSGQASLDEILYQTQNENLHFIFAGQCPPNPAELMGSTAFDNMLREQRENYDYIFIDTPPVGVVIDAAVCAPFCDGAVMIISLGEISGKFARMSKEQLERSGCKVLGVVLNDAKQRKTDVGKRLNNYYSNKKKEELSAT